VRDRPEFDTKALGQAAAQVGLIQVTAGLGVFE
jgi:hypothetical protein